MSDMPLAATLIGETNVEPFGGSVGVIADLDGDGQVEYLTLQTAGQFQAECTNWAAVGADAGDMAVYCLTAVKLDGTVMWQDGKPHDRPDVPFIGHGGGRMLLAEDVNADGRTEIIMVRGSDLLMLDGATGRELMRARLPSDNCVNLHTAQLGDPAGGRQIICKVNDRSYSPWEYANPIIIFNGDLSVRHEPFAVRGAGHNLVAFDFDGDGRDELLIGYSLLDHDLRTIWQLDFGPDFDYAGDHADNIDISDLDGDGRMEIRYAGSEDFYVVDLDGNVRSKTSAGHSQKSIEGPWGPSGIRRIIMSEKNRGLWGLDVDGRVLWNRTDINGYAMTNVRWRSDEGERSWAMFKRQLKPFETVPFTSDPEWSRGIWPSLIDGDGTTHEVFPWRDEYAHPSLLIRSKRSYDAGIAYDVKVLDIDGDGLDEVAVIDRRRLWLFHCQT